MLLPLVACALSLAQFHRPSGGVLGDARRTLVPGRTVFVGSERVPSAPPRLGGREIRGIAGSGPVPANCGVAVGPRDIVQVTNGRIAFFDKSGAQTFEQPSGEFFLGLAETPSPQEPRALFNEAVGRFIVVFVENDAALPVSNILVAVSDDDDPAGAWHQYKIDAHLEVGEIIHWLGRPGLGFNALGICVTGTYTPYGSSTANRSGFFNMPLAPMLDGDPVTVVFVWDIFPYAQMGESNGAVAPYIYGALQKATNTMRIYRVQNVGDIDPVVFFRDTPMLNSPVPPETVPSTDGGVIQTQRNRVLSVAWRDDNLLVVNNSGSSMVGIREHIYRTTNYVAGDFSAVSGALASSPTTHYFVPACALNKWNDAGIVFTASSASVTSDMMMTGRLITDAQIFLQPPVPLEVAGGSPYLDTGWGMYAGVDVDPVDGETFWGVATVVGSNGWWETRIVPFHISRTWPVVPASFSLFRGSLVAGTVGSLAADDGDSLVARAGVTLVPTEAPVQLVCESVAPSGTVLGIDLHMVGRVNTPGLSQRLELFDWGAGSWVPLGTRASTTADSSHTVAAPGPLSRFVQPGTGLVRAKASFFRTGVTLVFPWSAAVDQVELRIRAR